MSDNPFAKDVRSPLARALGTGKPSIKTIEGFAGCGGRLAGVPLAVRSLAAGAHLEAQADAFKFLIAECGYKEDHLYTEAGERLVEFETKIQLLSRALVQPKAPDKPVAASAMELRALLEPDEINVLFGHFLGWQEERSPISRAERWEEVEDAITALGKGSMPLTWLNSFDASSLRFMLSELAIRYATLMRPPSSPTSPSSDSDLPSESASD